VVLVSKSKSPLRHQTTSSDQANVRYRLGHSKRPVIVHAVPGAIAAVRIGEGCASGCGKETSGSVPSRGRYRRICTRRT